MSTRPPARVAAGLAVLVLLAGPTALAFFSGGYFDEARSWAGLAAWALVVVALVVVPRPLPRGLPAWVTLGGLGAFAAWTLLSTTWAAVAGNAYHYGQIAFLYLGVALAAAILLRDRRRLALVEPALALGVLIVVGYGLAGRLLPGVLHYAHSISAEGRLEQPLTYWNAMGELSAIGFVLCAALAGDAARPAALRAGSAAAGVPLAVGVYISFSRGALFAAVAGLLTLVVVAGRRERLEASVVVLLAGAVAALAAAPWHGFTSLGGSASTRESQGLIVLAILLAVSAAAAAAQLRLAARRRGAPLRLPRRAPLLAGVLIACGLALAIVVGAKEHSGSQLSAGATRFVSLQSNRYDYWRVAMRAFEAEPVRGVGAGGWSLYWLRYRTITEFARDAHSLPIQTLAELGLIGVGLLGVFLGGLWLASLRALRSLPALACSPIAGVVVYLAHSPLDWDWEMPALTLVAMVLVGALIAQGELAGEPQSASAIRGASRRKIQTANAQMAR